MRNQAAWLQLINRKPLKVDSAPMPEPGPNEVVVKNAFAAVNPVDRTWQDNTNVMESFFPVFPLILGCEVAGQITKVGKGVSSLKEGMRVMAHARMNGHTAYGGFQLYTLCAASLVAPLPDSISYEQAVVLPLAISTAAAGLYLADYLALPFPKSAEPVDKTIVVWDGSSSLGSAVIQLAVASGIKVVATAPPDELDYVKGFGASQVFDHSKSSIVDDIVSGLINSFSNVAGVYDATSSPDTIRNSAMVASQVEMGPVKTIVITHPLMSGIDLPKDVQAKYLSMRPTTMLEDVESAVWGKFVPEALADGSLQCQPDPVVVGEGLAKVQDALDMLQEGVAAKKLVIKLQEVC